MSIENTSQLFPEGEYTLEVSNIPEKKERGSTYFWEFQFSTELDGAPTSYTEFLPLWLCGPLFKALGFPEIRPGSYDVEPTLALGRRLKGRVVHEEIKSGSKQGQLVSRLKELVPIAEDPQMPSKDHAKRPSSDTLPPGEDIPF